MLRHLRSGMPEHGTQTACAAYPHANVLAGEVFSVKEGLGAAECLLSGYAAPAAHGVESREQRGYAAPAAHGFELREQPGRGAGIPVGRG